MAYHVRVSELKAMTVVETPAFIAAATRCLSEEEKHELIGFLAFHPEHGVLIRGTGGVRKLRWAVGSKGKSGGVRVIYFAHSEKIPLFLLTVYKKGRKSDLSAAEKNAMRQLVRDLVTNYHKG